MTDQPNPTAQNDDPANFDIHYVDEGAQPEEVHQEDIEVNVHQPAAPAAPAAATQPIRQRTWDKPPAQRIEAPVAPTRETTTTNTSNGGGLNLGGIGMIALIILAVVIIVLLLANLNRNSPTFDPGNSGGNNGSQVGGNGNGGGNSGNNGNNGANGNNGSNGSNGNNANNNGGNNSGNNNSGNNSGNTGNNLGDRWNRLVQLDPIYRNQGLPAWAAAAGFKWDSLKVDARQPEEETTPNSVVVISGHQVIVKGLSVSWPACFTTDQEYGGGRQYRPDPNNGSRLVTDTGLSSFSGTATIYARCDNWSQLDPKKK
jgi:hypothetical protein